MRLSDILDIGSIRIPLRGRNKTEIIEEMVDILVESGKVTDREGVLVALLEREKLMSTGVGDGVAIPHARSDGVNGLMAAFGRTAEEIDYQALDEKPVRLILLLVAPEDSCGLHLAALGRISRMLSYERFRNFLLRARSPAEVMSTIAEEEEKLS